MTSSGDRCLTGGETSKARGVSDSGAPAGDPRHREAPSSEVSDEQLVEQFLASGRRDDAIFAEIFRRRRRDVWRVCWRFFRNSQDAEDVTQEVFFTVYRKLPQFAGGASLRTWLQRIAANTCRNELRNRSRRPQGKATALEDAGPIAALAESAEDRVMRRQRETILARALAALSPAESDLLRQVEFAQRPYADVAAELGVSVSAVKMRVLRARLALAESHRRLQTKEPES
ncbi:MAG: RNA polymerase sigma factor [Acidobacteriota bacterium]|nr:RNA polymerase sigma factor [Acidobacteriota bacterium]